MNTLTGASKSKTIWAATALAVLSNVAPLVPQLLAQAGLHAGTIQAVGTACAILMIALRTVTSESLTEKGTPNETPSPVIAPVAPKP